MSDVLRFLLWTLKPIIGNVRIRFDREKKVVYIERKGEILELTYDQAIDKIEEAFNDE